MDAIKNLPAPLRFGIPLVLVLVIGLVAWMTMFKPPAPVEIVSTQDVSVFNTAKSVLTGMGIEPHETQDGNKFMLAVPQSEATEAAEALARSGIKDRTGLAKKLACPAAPGFTATKAANERADNCAAAMDVQNMLLAAGAIAANVKVSQQSNESFLGPEKAINVVAQVFLPGHMKGKWSAEDAARAISRTVGTSLDRVSITDDQLQTMFDGSATGKGAPGAAASSLSLGCGDIAAATEVETKRAAVRSCYEGTIGSKLTELLGGSDRYVLSVEPTIDSVARTTTKVTNTKGPVADRSAQSGSGQKAEDVSMPPNTQETIEQNPAGDISSLRINVTLDKGVVTDDQMVAVKSLLASYVDTRRGDPVPTVKMSKFTNGAGDKSAGEDLDQIRENALAKAAADQQQPMLGGGAAPKTEMPAWATAVMAVLVIGMLTAVLVLWRRSAAMAKERERLEQSFQQEQRLFENFAQQNPDDLARDLNALFGAPSAPEPTYRG